MNGSRDMFNWLNKINAFNDIKTSKNYLFQSLKLEEGASWSLKHWKYILSMIFIKKCLFNGACSTTSQVTLGLFFQDKRILFSHNSTIE